MTTINATPKLGGDPNTVGYYAYAARNRKVGLMWVERVKTPNGYRPAGQWWLPTYYRSAKEADAALSVLNDTTAKGHRSKIVPPTAVEGVAS